MASLEEALVGVRADPTECIGRPDRPEGDLGSRSGRRVPEIS